MRSTTHSMNRHATMCSPVGAWCSPQNLGKTLDVRVGDQLRLQTPHGPQQMAVLALVPYFSTVIGTVGMNLDQMRDVVRPPGSDNTADHRGRGRGSETAVG